MLVYFKESNRRRYERGITINLFCEQYSQYDVQSGVQLHVNPHKSSHPEVPIHKVIMGWVATHKALNDPRHEVTDDDEIADSDTETFDRNGRIKNYRSVGIGQLR